jgi:hypothetical protein
VSGVSRPGRVADSPPRVWPPPAAVKAAPDRGGKSRWRGSLRVLPSTTLGVNRASGDPALQKPAPSGRCQSGAKAPHSKEQAHPEPRGVVSRLVLRPLSARGEGEGGEGRPCSVQSPRGRGSHTGPPYPNCALRARSKAALKRRPSTALGVTRASGDPALQKTAPYGRMLKRRTPKDVVQVVWEPGPPGD